MKRWTILLVGALGLHLQVIGCDLCNLYLGLNPQYNNNQVGIRLRMRHSEGLHSHTHVAGATGTHSHAGLFVKDTWLSSEVYARVYLNPKWVVFGSMPYAVNLQTDATGATEMVNGLGDLPLLMQRQVFNRPAKDSAGFGHRMFAGAGVKLPTGRFDLTVHDDPHLQAGTGSWDGLVAVTYMALWRRWGLSCDANARLSTTNRSHYRFANRLNTTLTLFYALRPGKWTLMPTLGGYLEAAGHDVQERVYVEGSGGVAAFGTGGLEAYRGRFSWVLSAQLPMLQDLHGAQPKSMIRSALSMGVVF